MNLREFRGLRGKLVASLALATLVPMGLVSSITLTKADRSIEERVGANLADHARAAIDKIDRNLFERYGDVQSFAFHPAARGSAAEVTAAANFFCKAYGIYDLMLIVDLDGKVVACNDVAADGKPIASRELLGTDVSTEPWFAAVRSGTIATGESWYADPRREPLVRRACGGDGYALTFAAPIGDAAGRMQRIWVNYASWSRVVGEITDEVRSQLAMVGSKTVTTQVLARDGTRLDNLDSTDALSASPGSSRFAVTAHKESGVDGFTVEDDPAGAQLVGRARSTGALGFAGYGWNVLVRQQAGEARAATSQLHATFWTIAGAVILIGLAFSIWFSASLATPLRSTCAVVESVARGELGRALNVDSHDEIGRMANAVRHTSAVLGALVAESSRLLAAAKEGRLGERIDASKFDGSYRELCNGMNDLLATIATPIREGSAVLHQLARGNLDAELTGSFPGELQAIPDSVRNIGSVLRQLIAQLHGLVAAADAGQLSARLDAGPFEGSWRELCTQMNRMLDGLLAPIGEASAVLARVAQGDLTATMKLECRGDHRRVQEHLEQTTTVLRSVTSELSRRIAACREGRLSERAPLGSLAGSYRELLEQVNQMLDSVVQPIQEAGGVLERVAGGDLTARVTGDYSGDHNRMKVAVNSAVDAMAGAVHEIAASADQLGSAANEFSATAREMGAKSEETGAQVRFASDRCEHVHKSIQSVAAAAEELSVSIREIARNSSDASTMATDAVQSAQSTNDSVQRLGQSSLEIGNVVKLIASIAEQTNLLALNAAIEAARAGDAGRGFAVVANEVKELARQTAGATDQIGKHIATIQADTRGAVTAIQGIGQVVKQISEYQNSIASAVEEQSATTQEISRSVNEAACASAEIAVSMTGVNKTAQQNVSGATKTRDGSHELEQMALGLQRLVGRFELGAAEIAAARPAREREPEPELARA